MPCLAVICGRLCALRFVQAEHWDEASYGPLDAAKLVEETIFGKTMRGAYISKYKEGHYDLEEFETTAVEEHHMAHTDDGALADQGLAMKRKACPSRRARCADVSPNVSCPMRQPMSISSPRANAGDHGGPHGHGEETASRSGAMDHADH